jgi:3-dehydroquinate dehydratase
MGKNHPPEIIRRLRVWHAIAEKQVAVLVKGDFDELSRLIDQSVAIQASLDADLAHLNPGALDHESITLLQSIQKIQAALVTEMQKGCAAMGDKIETLRKNTNSLKGYKQKNHNTSPRFFTKRT